MAGVNWGGIANSGFDAFGNFQGGWEVGRLGLLLGRGMRHSQIS
jgi:hypothetical protein